MSPTETARRVARGTRKPENWAQLSKFVIVGGTGYIVNLIVFAILTEAFDLHHIAAAVLAFCVAVTNNFLLNRHWTFTATGGHAGFQAARFFTVSVLALAVNLVALELLIRGDVPEVAAQAIAIAIAMPFNFLGNKLWTFDQD